MPEKGSRWEFIHVPDFTITVLGVLGTGSNREIVAYDEYFDEEGMYDIDDFNKIFKQIKEK